jgi:putative heme-binding domain-containing protein
LYLASAAERLDQGQHGEAKWSILEALSRHGQDAEDHNLPKMIWFGLEPLVTSNSRRALALAGASKIPLLTQHVARRLADAEQFERLLTVIGAAHEDTQLNLLLGLRDAVDGRYDMRSPAGWSQLYPQLRAAGGEPARIALQLSQQFGDSVAAETMLATLQDLSASPDDRRQALQGLAGRRRDELRSQLVGLLSDKLLRRDAIRAAAAFDDDALGKTLLERYAGFSDEDRLETIHTMSSRSSYARQLTDAIESGKVPRRDVPAYVARLLRRFVGPRFVDVWGSLEELDTDKQALFTKYRTLLTDETLAGADKSAGRAIFQRTCAACHKLYGHGGNIGPDITGANRTNLEYLLGNILTPSAIIQDAYKMHIVLTDDGRVYSGIPADENERQLKLRIADRDQPVTIPKSQIESRDIAAVSMMPEGTLTNLKDNEVIDLIAYLKSLNQVPLPDAAQ